MLAAQYDQSGLSTAVLLRAGAEIDARNSVSGLHRSHRDLPDHSRCPAASLNCFVVILG